MVVAGSCSIIQWWIFWLCVKTGRRDWRLGLALLCPIISALFTIGYAVILAGAAPYLVVAANYFRWLSIVHFMAVTGLSYFSYHSIITDQRLKNRLLEERELDRLRLEMVQNISHELRTPVAIVVGYLDMLNKGDTYGPLSETHQQPIRAARDGVQRLYLLVQRMVTPAQKMDIVPFDVMDLIREVILGDDVWSGTRRDREDVAMFTSRTAPLVIEADRDKIRICVLELVSNAIKFGGTIITIGVQELNGSFMISVTDNGKGIPPDKLDLIFERFFQVEGGMTRGHEGAGMGLYAVQSVAKMHNGRVEVESELGKGSVFRLYLPKR
jgi:signal transduction histidine kinase